MACGTAIRWPGRQVAATASLANPGGEHGSYDAAAAHAHRRFHAVAGGRRVVGPSMWPAPDRADRPAGSPGPAASGGRHLVARILHTAVTRRPANHAVACQPG